VAGGGAQTRFMNADCLLVACAAGQGPTREEVEEIGRTLAERGFRVRAVREAATTEEVAAYSGLVLGGALDAGRLHSLAVRLLKRLTSRLVRRPVAVVAIGPRPLEDWSAIPPWENEVGDLFVPLVTAREEVSR
jgi:menaquinone-dependent protoporphyrinogen IX oxidase